MRKTFAGVSEFLAPVFALWAKPSACILAAVLVATTLSSCKAMPGDPLDQLIGYLIDSLFPPKERKAAAKNEVRAEVRRCLDTSPCTPERWDEIEADATRVGLASYVLRARGTIEDGAAPQASLTQEEREAALAASFGVRDFRKLADDVIEKMASDRGLQEALGATQPTLLIAAIEDQSDTNLDAPFIHNSLRVRLSKTHLFELVRRDYLKVLSQEQTLGDLADADTAAQIGRTLGAQYMLHGSIADTRTRQEGEVQIVYTLTLVLTDIETGLDFWGGEAEFIKTSSQEPP